jgi:hypothetical protein
LSSFEYITVLISIVVGLGVTQILTGIADLIKKAHKVVLYWPHVLWILFVLLLLIQDWWLTYELKLFHPWRLPSFLFIMLYPINLFVLAKLLFPNKHKGKVIDLKVFYYKHFRGIFLMLAISAFISVCYNIFILNLNLQDQLLQILLAISISFITLKNYSNEGLHKVVSIVVLLTLVGSILIEWNVWLIE